ncbi:MBOAT family O-acyltransferase [Pedobacter changchengzhani]|uniref:MBOAT family O-acyltransferase n=1 Tax=Pedobacter changchengzhani TaxID=2529274 RepID=UPI001A9CC228|nr:MBOAT family protein [Pedobacter changchengzhani]
MFKKIVIADQCAEFANTIFNHSGEYSGSTLVVGAIFFTFQIYGDFSGYSDIALGTARLFGIELLRNFAFPYFSRDIAEFWRRWHISLSTWFRDYLYIPLGGSKGGTWMKIRNTFAIFIVSGFWHGANWTFIIWGLLNALYIMPSVIFKTNRNNIEIVAKGKYLPTFKDTLNILLTFSLTVFAWIFFRSENLNSAFTYISKIFTTSLFSVPAIKPLHLFVILVAFLIIEWLGREEEYALAAFGTKWPKTLRISFYYLLIISIFWFNGSNQQFIYFQF